MTTNPLRSSQLVPGPNTPIEEPAAGSPPTSRNAVRVVDGVRAPLGTGSSSPSVSSQPQNTQITEVFQTTVPGGSSASTSFPPNFQTRVQYGSRK